MSLLNGIKQFGGNLLDVARALGQQQFAPIGNPELESQAGEMAPLLRARYDQQFRANRAKAVRQGARFYEMNDIAGAASQPQYDQDLMRAVTVADALRQRRDTDGRMEALKKHIDGSKDLTDSQKELANALPPEQASKLLADLELPSNDRFAFMSIPGGGIARVDKRDGGEPQIVVKPQVLGGGGLGAGGGLDSNTLDLAAQQYLTRGTMPPLGNSKSAANLKVQILTRAAEMAQQNGDSAAAVQAQIAANDATRGAMKTTQKQLSGTQIAEKSMLAHFRNALAISKKLDRTNVPVIDRWLQAGKKEIAGDPDVAAFGVALTTALNEYAKILSGGVQSAAAITEGARQEVENMLTNANTHEQLIAVYNLIVKDAAAKEKAMRDELADQQSSLDPHGAGASSGDHQQSAAERAAALGL